MLENLVIKMSLTGEEPSIESVAEDLSDIDLKSSELEAAAKTIQARFRRNRVAALGKKREENESENIGMKHEDSKDEKDFGPDPEIFKVTYSCRISILIRQSRQKCPYGCNLRTPRWQFQRSVTLECPVSTNKWQGFYVQLFLINAFPSEHQTKT